jgi:hypothetical protein
MKKRMLIILLCSAITGCGRYAGWEYVRIEEQVPAKNCLYKMQEACSLPTNQCLNWHKKRATTYGADTVVITHSENLDNYVSSAWTGRVKGGESASTVADYYYCNGPKNIRPQ